jgi:hypothetical protein
VITDASRNAIQVDGDKIGTKSGTRTVSAIEDESSFNVIQRDGISSENHDSSPVRIRQDEGAPQINTIS